MPHPPIRTAPTRRTVASHAILGQGHLRFIDPIPLMVVGCGGAQGALYHAPATRRQPPERADAHRSTGPGRIDGYSQALVLPSIGPNGRIGAVVAAAFSGAWVLQGVAPRRQGASDRSAANRESVDVSRRSRSVRQCSVPVLVAPHRSVASRCLLSGDPRAQNIIRAGKGLASGRPSRWLLATYSLCSSSLIELGNCRLSIWRALWKLTSFGKQH